MLKLSIFLAFIFALGYGVVKAAPIKPKEPKFYADSFLNHKSVLIPEAKSGTNQTCFRTAIILHASVDENAVQAEMRDSLTGWALGHTQKWNLAKANWNGFWGNAKCSSTKLDYIFLYDLPEGWENGAEVSFFDEVIIFTRKLFTMNEPESCEDVEKFFKFVKVMGAKVELKDESVDIHEHEGDVEVGMSICYPLKTYDDDNNEEAPDCGCHEEEKKEVEENVQENEEMEENVQENEEVVDATLFLDSNLEDSPFE